MPCLVSIQEWDISGWTLPQAHTPYLLHIRKAQTHFSNAVLHQGGHAVFVYGLLPGRGLLKGVSYGGILWLGMMLVAMPMAGQGLFGLALGPSAPVMTLVLHLVYGVTIAAVFGKLVGCKACTPAAED